MDLSSLRISKKENVNIVFVGHVDAGKSTICGQILVLQGIVDKRTIDKYKVASKESGRESWYLSWCLDTNPEEREKGKTTEVGSACFELKNRKINILDAPGHKQYVFEMISGANSADIGVLVVSARISEFEAGFEKGGQTREHILLMKSSPIQKLIVLVNKMDDPSVNWNENRFLEIKKKITNYVKNLFPLPDFIPISGITGENLCNNGGIEYGGYLDEGSNGGSENGDDSKEHDNNLPNYNQNNSSSWYKGPSFFDLLDNIQLKPKDLLNLDITILENSKLTGSSYVYGLINCGVLKKDITLKHIPSELLLNVNSILDLDDNDQEEFYPGDSVKIKFKNCDLDEVEIGHRLVNLDNNSFKSSNLFTCGLNILDSNGLICVGFTCMLHLGIVKIQCKIKELRKASEPNKKIRFVRTGDKALALIETENKVVLSEKKERFSIRIADKTLAVGVVRNVR
ncbi:Eukaryotic peptide chain release factor GTP-binding subunit ERF3A [Nosema bombycis CQ1]|uniref:Eukaryotic peptide chain release factor GTP-binding subunit ERF3A n=1 Tax=Nosema bombycis (strain CQ1 / CVCC 102059) TaxID=578461 RepID=R0MIW0_NOSB1|nr:Eukaryotic peptide chain release factor GTP-binding subunit ERF3A [Nosema bombycis CQ1]|eukprot:EOB14135.1 Eukaryotic peptide chain release factor GTP-binding subunit ERF3A [Nosema bombycis CQ1]